MSNSSEIVGDSDVRTRTQPTPVTADRARYGYRNCASLFGYAAAVHERSGGVCELCGCGSDLDFDLWRQLTVEHLIGESQGGYPREIRQAVRERFPDETAEEQELLALALDAANTVTACSFCNSTTSRKRYMTSMGGLLAEAVGTPEDVIASITGVLATILEEKRRDVAWKLESVRDAFDTRVAPKLAATRLEMGNAGRDTGSRRIFDAALHWTLQDLRRGVFSPRSEGDIVGLLFHHTLNLAGPRRRSAAHITATTADGTVPDLMFGDGEIVVEVKLSKPGTGGYTQALQQWQADALKLRSRKTASRGTEALFLGFDQSNCLSNPASSNYFQPSAHGLTGEWQRLDDVTHFVLAHA